MFGIHHSSSKLSDDADILENNLLSDFLFPNGDIVNENENELQTNEDEIFNRFINTDLAQSDSYVSQFHTHSANIPHANNSMPRLMKEEIHCSQDRWVNINNYHQNFAGVPINESNSKALFKESYLSLNSIPCDDSQSIKLNYYQQCEQFLNQHLKFGRSAPIKSIYLNPAEFLNLNSEDLMYKLHITGMPSKSRVETQIKLGISISPKPRQFLIHLPADCITKQKCYLTHNLVEYPSEFTSEILYLESFLICASNNKPTYVCPRCVKREQRRASRRKSGLSDNLLWCNNENKRAVVFNSRQVFLMKDEDCTSTSKSFSLSARIVCYCRHHKEPEGFKILFVLRDSQGKVLGKDITSSIMIMDKKPTKQGMDTNGEFAEDITGFSSMDSKTDDSSTAPTSDYSGNESKVKLEDPRHMFLSLPVAPVLSPTSICDESSESHTTDPNTKLQLATHVLQTPSSAATARTNGYKRKGVWQDCPLMSLDTSSRHSSLTKSDRSLSPSSLSITTTSSLLNTNLVQSSTHFPDSSTLSQSNRPFIQRIIPSQGPIKGGIEVTLLGSNFKPGMIVKFGDNKALSTQCWSDSTIITYLPPAAVPGQTLVTIFDQDDLNLNVLDNMTNSRAIFTYIDDTDRQLIELALQIVGLKMNGKLEDARNIAKRIVGNDGNISNGSTPGSGFSPAANSNSNLSHVYYSDELLLLKVIRLLSTSSNLSMCTEEGQTMLHLSCLKGYYQLASVLVTKGAYVDAKDSFGFTPLHFACLHGDTKIIRLLVQCKANISVHSANDVTPKMLFIENHDTDDIKYKEYLSEVLDLLETTDNTDIYGWSMRKTSDSSFHSNIYDEEYYQSLSETSHIYLPKILPESISDNSEIDINDYEEDGDESLLHGDDEPESTMAVVEPPESTACLKTNSNQESSLWNRVLNVFNDELPAYEDLFPSQSPKEKSLVITSDTSTILPKASGIAVSEDSQTSEDEDEALQALFNRFFQQRQNFQNDKMLLFFWLPLMVTLITSVLIFNFGRDGNTVHHLSEFISDYLRTGLGKVLLGNKRMTGVLRESFQTLQNSRILSEVITE